MKTFPLEDLLSLYSIPSIGPTRMRKLISVLGSPSAVLQAGTRRLISIEGIDIKTAEKIRSGGNPQFVAAQMEAIDKHQVKVLSYWDKAYPEQLKSIYDPPAFLFYKGNIQLLDQPTMAVVGTRKPTGYGRMMTERFTKELVDKGFAIVSGFARGVDSVAHKTALKNGGPTFAVLGNGLDVIYPPENHELFEEMCRKGVIMTEYPMGTRPDAGNFPKRNRIISGLSIGILITEAGQKSGALLTAFYGADQNREVFAIPGSIVSEKSVGVNDLIKKGAKLVQSIEDILEEFGDRFGSEALLSTEKAAPIPDLNGSLKTIYDHLSSQPIHIDQLALQTHLSPSETLSSLLTLELMGLIRQMAGKMFIRL